MVLVEHGIEEALAIRRPGAAAAGVFDDVVEILAGGEITDPQGEIFRALVVIAPEALVMTGRMAETGNPFFAGENADLLGMLPFLILTVILYFVGGEIVLAGRKKYT